MWWNGPEYLSQLEEMWPTMSLPGARSDDIEKKYRGTFLASTDKEICLPELKLKGTRLDLA